MESVESTHLLIIIGWLGLLVYFLPTFIAGLRHHANRVPIFLLNLFLGWSVLGWVGALIWCATAQKDPTVQP